MSDAIVREGLRPDCAKTFEARYLRSLTGKIGRPGASPFSITDQCNAMGTREAGFASSMPGYRKFESAKDREDLARLWNITIDALPVERGLAYPDIIEAC